MRAGLYIRVSTEEQALKGYSVQEQIDACARKAKELGATECIIFSEEGESGAYLDRPELEKLLQAIKLNEIQLVVALDTDRLARDLGTQIAIANEIEQYARLDFVFYSRGDPNNPEDNLFFHIKGAFAQYDRAKIRRNTSAGRRRKAMSGKIVIPGGWPGHPGVYGYRYVNDNNGPRLEIIEKEAEVIRYIYGLAHQEGYGVSRIVEHLNREGIPSPKGGVWHRSTVRRILTNETYAGTFYNYKYVSRMTNKRTPSGRRQIVKEMRPLEERISASVPAIIDRSTWEAVQAQLKQNSLRDRKSGSFFLLKGRVKCGLCGRSCLGETSGKPSPITNRRRTYYRCVGTKTGVFPKCKLPAISSSNNSRNPGLDNLVWEKVVEVINNPQLIKNYLDEAEDREVIENIEKQMERLKSKISDLEKQKDELLNLRLEGLLTAEQLKARLLKLENKKKAARDELDSAQKTLKAAKTVEIDPVSFCRYFQERIKSPTNEIKAQVINDLDIRVVVYPDYRFEVNWPFDMVTEIVEDVEVFSEYRSASMTPETKQILYEYAKKRLTTPAAIIREAIRYAPLDGSYKRLPRSRRFRSTVCLTQEDIRKITMMQKTYGVSSTQAIEWAITTYLKNLGLLER